MFKHQTQRLILDRVGSYLTRWTGTVTAKGLQKFFADCVEKMCPLKHCYHSL